tara:strand:+ start:1053 stop:1433 length:381 start_codon:yes stop_codon:yes gene_type:complete
MDQVKVALIEQKLDDLKPIIVKLDSAIEKLSEVNISVSRMLAVHEERISKQEEIDTVLFAKIDKLRDKMDTDHDSVLSRLRGLEKRVWMVVGGLTVLSFTVNSPLVASLLTPTPQPPTIVRGSIDG